jgi:hypothetical protein
MSLENQENYNNNNIPYYSLPFNFEMQYGYATMNDSIHNYRIAQPITRHDEQDSSTIYRNLPLNTYDNNNVNLNSFQGTILDQSTSPVNTTTSSLSMSSLSSHSFDMSQNESTTNYKPMTFNNKINVYYPKPPISNTTSCNFNLHFLLFVLFLYLII